MDARNRSLPDWFTRIRTGQIRLPRFQRFEAWGHNEVADLVETMLHGLPSGATLVLEIGNKEPFISRALETAPETSERVTENLLDGQQRLTALWRSLHDNYPDRTYLLHFEQDEDGKRVPRVLAQNRYVRKGARYPLWCDSPKDMWERGYLPLRLLNEEDNKKARAWSKIASSDEDTRDEIVDIINELSTAIKVYNIPYLSLPSTTPKHVALDVFIKMNTSSVQLSAFDIVVAQLEEASGLSLHDLVDNLRASVPAITKFADPGTLALDVASLRSNRPTGQQSYQKLDLPTVADDWAEISEGIKWALAFLESERIFDAARLPSIAVLPVLAAIHSSFPTKPDEAGNARQLIRAYIWRAFLTRRYDQAAASRAYQDFRGLRRLLAGEESVRSTAAPIFDEEATPLPTVDDLVTAGWPKKRDILARGILAVSLRAGARDIADDQTVSAEHLVHREYHHLFPDSLLTKIGGIDAGKSMRALNCALITWSTNRTISSKSPLQYLEDRTNNADLGETVIRSRLASHVIPYDELSIAGPYSEANSPQVVNDYDAFLQARAKLMMPAIEALCNGEHPQ